MRYFPLNLKQIASDYYVILLESGKKQIKLL